MLNAEKIKCLFLCDSSTRTGVVRDDFVGSLPCHNYVVLFSSTLKNFMMLWFSDNEWYQRQSL